MLACTIQEPGWLRGETLRQENMTSQFASEVCEQHMTVALFTPHLAPTAHVSPTGTNPTRIFFFVFTNFNPHNSPSISYITLIWVEVYIFLLLLFWYGTTFCYIQTPVTLKTKIYPPNPSCPSTTVKANWMLTSFIDTLVENSDKFATNKHVIPVRLPTICYIHPVLMKTSLNLHRTPIIKEWRVLYM